MSTKIYNGYKIKVLSIKELHEFYKDTRKIANEVMEEKYFDLFAIKMLNIAYDLERLKNDHEKLEHYLKYSFEIAQEKLLKYQKANRAVREMKTTKVNLCINKSDVMWGHIGDSRLYYFKGKRLIKRTLDHSYVQSLCRSKEIKETDIRNHPDRNVLLRVMGEDWNEPKYELSKKYRLKKNMSFLLCSDGFWELIDEKQMKMCLAKAQNVDEWIALMKNIIDENGKGKEMDNYSAIAVWVR